MKRIRPAARRFGAALLLFLAPAAAAAPLALDSFSPPAAPLGHEVILRGRGLSNVTAVTFNGVGAPFRPLHDGALRARVPAGRVDGPVTVWRGLDESAAVPGFRRTAEPLSVVVWNVNRPDAPPAAHLAPPADLTNAVDAAVTANFGVAVRDTGELVLWGGPPGGVTSIPPEARDLVQVSANGRGWLALRADGRIIAGPDWGTVRPPVTNGFVSVMLSDAISGSFVGLGADGGVIEWRQTIGTPPFHGYAGAVQVVPSHALRRDGQVITSRGQNPTQPGFVVQMAAPLGSAQGLMLGRWGAVQRLGTQTQPTGAGAFDLLSRGLAMPPAAVLADGTPRYELASPSRSAPAWLTGVRTIQAHGTDFVALAALPPRFTRAPGPVAVNRGGTARLAVEVAGTGPLRLRWFKDGVAIPGATAPVFEIADAEIFDEGAYACLATGPHGVALSPAAQVRIIATPAVTGLRDPDDGTLVLEGVNLGEVTAVTFNGVGAFPERTAAGRLVVRRPAGNTAGPIKVWVGNTAFDAPQNVQVPPTALALARWVHVGPDEPAPASEFTDPPASPLLEDLVQVVAARSDAWALRRDGRVVSWNPLAPPRLLGGDIGAVKIAPVVSGLVVALRPDGSLVTASTSPPILFQPGPSPAGPFVTVHASPEGVAALRPDGRLAVWGPLAGSNPPPSLQAARDLVVFGRQIAVLEQGGTVARWGQGQPVRLPPPEGARLVQLAHHGASLLALDDVRRVWRSDGQRWHQPTGLEQRVVRLESGDPWACALYAGGRAVRFGWSPVPRPAPGWLGPVQQASATDHALLVLRAGPPALAGEPEDLWLAPGAPAVLEARPEPGQLDLRYTWLRDGQPVAEGTHATLTVSAGPGEAFTYDVVAGSPAGVSTQRVARVRGAAGVPFVMAVQPEAAPAGAAAILEGNFLASVTAVTFNGHAAWFRLRPDGTLEARVPNRFATGEVTVWSHARAFPTGRQFTLLPSPGEAVSWGHDHAVPLPPPPALTNVLLVGAGTNWSLAALADGATLLWGQPPPGVSLPLTNIVAAAGVNPTLLLDFAGRPQARGLLPGQSLGALLFGDDTLDVAALDNHRAALRRGGSLHVVNLWSGLRLPLPAAWTNLVALAAAGEQLVALRADGRVLVWGGNRQGQRDVPPTLGRAVAVAAGGPNLAALTRDGGLVRWGRDPLAAGLLEPPAFGLALGADFAVLAMADGRPVVLGNRFDPPLRPPEGFTGVGAVAAGAGHLVALGGFPPNILAAPQPVTVPLGSPEGIELRVEAAGSGPLHFRWLRDGQPFGGPDAPVLRLPAEPAGVAWYAAEVGNAFGARVSPAAEVRILGPLRLRGLQPGAGGTFHARLEREGLPGWEPLPGRRLVVETSADLVTWTRALYSLGAEGRLAFAPAAGGTAQFFRVREVEAGPP